MNKTKPSQRKSPPKHSRKHDNDAEAKAKVVEQIATILDKDESVREGVFRELHDRQQEQILGPSPLDQKGAGCAPFLPELIDTSNTEAKQKALETIRTEINGLQREVDANKHKATKLIGNAVWKAQAIGDRLLFAKWNLLEHGEYEDWVDDNFDGGLSTARAYTRIANYKNWKKIVAKLLTGTMTIKAALALIKQRGPEKKKDPDSRRKNDLKTLKESYGRLINRWTDKKLARLADHYMAFLDRIEEAAGEKPISVQLRLATSRLRMRLAAQRQVLDAYAEQADGSLTPRPLSELISDADWKAEVGEDLIEADFLPTNEEELNTATPSK